ncbi:MAG: hypothetical protein K8L99_32120 [Anaerolineae bacterium]|nr:hypothetical protein [Anaerolineae bacterium]
MEQTSPEIPDTESNEQGPQMEASSEEHEKEFIPKGAFYFVLLLIAGYAVYFFLIWYEIVILRGGGA